MGKSAISRRASRNEPRGRSVFLFSALSDESLDVLGAVADPERDRLEQEKRILLQGLKEFEADKAIGKVDAKDYEHLKKTAEARAVQIIKQLKDNEKYWLSKAQARAGVDELPPEAHKPLAVPSLDEVNPESSPSSAASTAPAPPADARIFAAGSTTLVNSTCSTCNTVNPGDAKFCIGCGRAAA